MRESIELSMIEARASSMVLLVVGVERELGKLLRVPRFDAHDMERNEAERSGIPPRISRILRLKLETLLSHRNIKSHLLKY